MKSKKKKGKTFRARRNRTPTIRYDEALPKFMDLVSAHLGSGALKRDCFLRDADGNMTYIIRGKVTEAKRDALTKAVKAAIPAYAGELPVATASELFDDTLDDPEAGTLEYVATAQKPRFVRLIERRIVGQDWVRGIAPPIGNVPPIIVFASHKGGVGRSTALAIAATEFARRGHSILAIDVDLEAPGLGESQQRAIFKLIAGEFMGADHRRGRTYTWVIDHLADAFRETTPRSFLIALRKAAQTRVHPRATPIDHLGIREGVQAASAVRVDQLGEDYPWIQTVLADLEGLEVPCPPTTFIRRWRTEGTVARVNQVIRRTSRPGPIGLESAKGPDEAEIVLLDALKSIGVVEERSSDRINMPDLFRVAAQIKRRGGVRPPMSK